MIFLALLRLNSGLKCQVYLDESFEGSRGKQITNLQVETYKPAGIRIYDTTLMNSSFIPQFINRFHHSSSHKVIRRVLRVLPGDTSDPLSLYESERLVRKVVFVRDCFIYSYPDGDTAVTLRVVAQDRFSLRANYARSEEIMRVSLGDLNFGGTGLMLSVAAAYDNSGYTAPYISASYPLFTKTLLQISGDYSFQTNSGLRSIRIARPALSPLFRYTGAFAHGVRYGNGGIGVDLPGSPAKQIRTDAWLGRNFLLYQQGYNTTGQLVFSAGASESTEYSPAQKYISRSLIFTTGFVHSKRFRENYLFSWEQISDFSLGYGLFLSQGWISQQSPGNHYSSLEVQAATKGWLGYVGLQLVGAIRSQALNAVESAMSGRFVYVSPRVISYDRYRIRFIGSAMWRKGGSQPLASPLVTDGRSEDIWQMNGRILTSLSNFSFDSRIVMYTPWSPFGFDVAPFVYVGFAQIRNWPALRILSGNLLAIGPGVILRSRARAINVLRLALVFYPGKVSDHQPLLKFGPPWVFDLPQTEIVLPEPLPAAGI